MIIVWRYILKEFLKVFTLSIFTFIALLLVVRGQEIARFATLQSELKFVFFFFLYQIPFILPLAIPISILISAYLLMQKLSNSFELTSLRASGLSAYKILFPLFALGIFFSIFNFFIVSELGPKSRLQTILLPYQTASKNPLVLLKKSKFINLKDSYIDLTLYDRETKAKDLVLALKDGGQNTLSLTIAKDLQLEENLLKAKNLTTLSSISQNESQGFNDIILENLEESTLEAQEISSFLQKPLTNLSFEHLTTKNCLIKRTLDKTTRSNTHSLLEVYRRLFSLFSPLTFMFIGISFGISVGRNPSKANLYILLCLAISLLLFFMTGKSIKTKPLLSLNFYLLPQLLCLVLCKRKLQNTLKGA